MQESVPGGDSPRFVFAHDPATEGPKLYHLPAHRVVCESTTPVRILDAEWREAIRVRGNFSIEAIVGSAWIPPVASITVVSSHTEADMETEPSSEQEVALTLWMVKIHVATFMHDIGAHFYWQLSYEVCRKLLRRLVVIDPQSILRSPLCAPLPGRFRPDALPGVVEVEHVGPGVGGWNRLASTMLLVVTPASRELRHPEASPRWGRGARQKKKPPRAALHAPKVRVRRHCEPRADPFAHLSSDAVDAVVACLARSPKAEDWTSLVALRGTCRAARAAVDAHCAHLLVHCNRAVCQALNCNVHQPVASIVHTGAWLLSMGFDANDLLLQMFFNGKPSGAACDGDAWARRTFFDFARMRMNSPTRRGPPPPPPRRDDAGAASAQPTPCRPSAVAAPRRPLTPLNDVPIDCLFKQAHHAAVATARAELGLAIDDDSD